MSHSNKEKFLCSDYSFGLNSFNVDFDRLMRFFYDNGIDCIGICHDRENEVSAHYHIITFPYLLKTDFEQISDIKKYYQMQIKGTVSDIVAYLLHYGSFYETTVAEKYKISDLKTNLNLKKYQNDLLKHGISLS